MINVKDVSAPALLAKSDDKIFTSSSSVTAIQYPASEIFTSSNIWLSRPSPFVTVISSKFEAKYSALSLLFSISSVLI